MALQPVTLSDVDWNGISVPPLTPHTDLALRRQGVAASELLYKPLECFGKALTEAHQKRVFDFHEEKRKELLYHVRKEREQIITEEWIQASESQPTQGEGLNEQQRRVMSPSRAVPRSPSRMKCSTTAKSFSATAILQEEKKLEKARKKRISNVEQKLLYEIKLAQIQHESWQKVQDDRKRLEQRRQQEEQERRNRLEQKRQTEMERLRIEQEDAQRKKSEAFERFEEELRLLRKEEEQDKRRRQEMIQSAAERARRQDEFRQELQRKFQDRVSENQRQHELLMLKEATRKRVLQEQRANLKSQLIEQHNKSMDKVLSAHAQLESLREQERHAYAEKQRKCEEQRKRFEQREREAQQYARIRAMERTGHIANAISKTQQQAEERRERLLNKEYEMERLMRETQELHRQLLSDLSLERQLRLADRLYNVERKRRKDKHRKDQIMQRIEYATWRANVMQSQKAALEEVRRENRDEATVMREQLAESFEQMKITKAFKLPEFLRGEDPPFENPILRSFFSKTAQKGITRLSLQTLQDLSLGTIYLPGDRPHKGRRHSNQEQDFRSQPDQRASSNNFPPHNNNTGNLKLNTHASTGAIFQAPPPTRSLTATGSLPQLHILAPQSLHHHQQTKQAFDDIVVPQYDRLEKELGEREQLEEEKRRQQIEEEEENRQGATFGNNRDCNYANADENEEEDDDAASMLSDSTDGEGDLRTEMQEVAVLKAAEEALNAASEAEEADRRVQELEHEMNIAQAQSPVATSLPSSSAAAGQQLWKKEETDPFPPRRRSLGSISWSSSQQQQQPLPASPSKKRPSITPPALPLHLLHQYEESGSGASSSNQSVPTPEVEHTFISRPLNAEPIDTGRGAGGSESTKLVVKLESFKNELHPDKLLIHSQSLKSLKSKSKSDLTALTEQD
mmetsp:Transcript_31959/g.51618  ORF Transcript_31959/g.51618 Transcript_31959/m.51618 type:complete len:912 (+) Transcript_31959:178-2913(+)|eukprot:CAMPEP_0184657766 /NCGR_PEP_ID=MMETSP0308-20130426/21751_1 /TAXON_ID=38269 /ORGANISM="Gloeochaete witrockiana, Strain SAG 46.84" /LENGTH=911 /DNA_ID=CAMNT_0027096017 /DNA_START=66 /DNA_END=2801 /DNA_ORIENTATION=-